MAIPDYQTLMLPVLRLAAKGEQRVADVADRVADEFGLSAEERETLLPSGRQRVLNNRIHWAKFYMSKAGLISSPARGRFVATEEGRKLLATNPDQINVALLMKWPSFREFYKSEREPASDSAEVAFEEKGSKSNAVTPEEQIETAYQAVQSVLAGGPPGPHRSKFAVVLRAAHRRSACRDGLRRVPQERGGAAWPVRRRRRRRCDQ